jgi:hypothetical protein
MTFRLAVLGLAATATCFAGSAGVAAAAPYCYETGPGYQKCVDGSTGGYFDPIYQGPKVFSGGNVPWVPTYSPPAAPAIPPANSSPNGIDALAGTVLNNIQNTLDADPGQPQFNVRVHHVSLVRTGDTSFEGMATMTAAGGPPHDIPVHVFNDGGTLTWRIDPGVMAVLLP